MIHEQEQQENAAQTAQQLAPEQGQVGPETSQTQVAQQAAQRGYLSGLGARQVTRSPRRPAPKAASGGWFSKLGAGLKGAASWVGDKVSDGYDAAAEKVGQAYDWTAEKAGHAKRVAGDVWDVGSDAIGNAGYKDGVLRTQVDAAEVMDLLPAAAQQALVLDRDGGNMVELRLDTKTGRLTAHAASLTLSALAMGPLTTGGAVLSDVTLVLSNPKGGVPVIDAKTDDLTGAISVGEVLAHDVRYEGPSGVLKAQAVVLSGLEASAHNPGGGVPMYDGAPDQLAGSFSVDGVVLRGLSGPAMQSDELVLGGLSGQADQSAGTAGLALNSARLGASEVAGRKIGGAELNGLKVDGANPDQPSLSASLKGASVHDLSGPEGSLKSASVKDVSTSWDAETETAKAALGGASVTGLKAGGAEVASASLAGLEASRTGAGPVNAAVAKAQAQKVKYGDYSAKALGVSDVEAKVRAGEGAQVDVDVGGLKAEGLAGAGYTGRSVQAKGLQVKATDDRVQAELSSAQVKGVKGADAAVGSASLGGLYLDAQRTKDGVQVASELKRADVKDARYKENSMKRAQISDLVVDGRQRGEKMGGAAKVGALDVAGVKTGYGDLDAAQLKGLSVEAQQTKDGLEGRAGLKGATLRGLDAGAYGTLDSATLKQLELSQAKGVSAGSLGAAEAQGYTNGDLEAKRLALSGLHGEVSGEHVKAGLDTVEAQGLKGMGAEVDKVNAEALKVDAQTGEKPKVDVNLGHAHAEGVKAEAGRWNARAELLDLEGGRFDYENGKMGAHVDGFDAEQIGFGVAGRDLKDEESVGGGYVSAGDLLSGVAPRIDSVDATFQAPLKAGDVGKWASIEQDTQLRADLQVRQNAIVAEETKVKLSEGVDAPLWIEADGAYMEREEGKDEAKIRADLSGWYDHDLTGYANEALGRKDAETLPLSLATLGALGATKLDHARDKDREKPEEARASADVLDMSKHKLDAKMKLSAGEITLGEQQRLSIREGGAKDNTIDVKSRGGEGMVVELVQLLLGTMSVQVAGQKVTGEKASVSNAKIVVSEDAQRASTFEGTIGKIHTEQMDLK